MEINKWTIYRNLVNKGYSIYHNLVKYLLVEKVELLEMEVCSQITKWTRIYCINQRYRLKQ